MEFFLEYIAYLNGNKFFWGVTMLLLNFGSRYVIGDLGKFHEQVLGNEIVKKIITFSLFFVATRDIIIAFVMTILYVIIIDGVLHEKRNFCILPKNYVPSDANIDEYKKAKEVVKRYEESLEAKSKNNVYELYKEAVQAL